MSSAACACNILGNVSNAGGIVGLAVQGAVGLAVGYQAIVSPHAALRETWETLGNIRTHLDAVTPERRQRIEAAAAMRLCRNLSHIEEHFQEYVPFIHLTHLLAYINPVSSLWDAHAGLSQEYEQSSYIQRHFGQLRQLIKNLEVEVKVLLMDTWVGAIQLFRSKSHPIFRPRLEPKPRSQGFLLRALVIKATQRISTPLVRLRHPQISMSTMNVC
jgi:hypothetical protein